MKKIYVRNNQVIVHRLEDMRKRKEQRLNEYRIALAKQLNEEDKKYGAELKKRRKKRKKKKHKRRRQDKGIDYYKSEEWQILRKKALKRDGHKCQECGKTKMLHVHHIKYRYHSKELKDLVILCKYCHADKHPVNRDRILKGVISGRRF